MVSLSFPVACRHVSYTKIEKEITLATTPPRVSHAHHRLPHPTHRLNADQHPDSATVRTRCKSYLAQPTPVPTAPTTNRTTSAYIPVFTMTDPATSTPSRFVANTETLEDVLKTQTVGLVHLSEFKKRRVDLAEQRHREAAEKATTDSQQRQQGWGGCELVSQR